MYRNFVGYKLDYIQILMSLLLNLPNFLGGHFSQLLHSKNLVVPFRANECQSLSALIIFLED
jgi:hypothetical protein